MAGTVQEQAHLWATESLLLLFSASLSHSSAKTRVSTYFSEGVCQSFPVTGSPGAPGNTELCLPWLTYMEVFLLLDTCVLVSMNVWS